MMLSCDWKICVCGRALAKCQCETNVDGAAEQRASLQSFADDAMKISGSFLQLVHLCYTTSEVLEALSGAAA